MLLQRPPFPSGALLLQILFLPSGGALAESLPSHCCSVKSARCWPTNSKVTGGMAEADSFARALLPWEAWPKILFTPQAADHGCGLLTKLSAVLGQRVPRLLGSTAAAWEHHTSSRPGPCWIRTEIALRPNEGRTDGKVWGFATLQMSAKFPARETFVHVQRS